MGFTIHVLMTPVSNGMCSRTTFPSIDCMVVGVMVQFPWLCLHHVIEFARQDSCVWHGEHGLH